MKSLKIINQFKTTITITLILVSQIYAGTNYYLNATNGSDNNTGKSPTQAWKTCAKLNASWSIFNDGDSILFKRGEIWAPTTGSIILRPMNKSGLIFGAYGLGAQPIISTAGLGGTSDQYVFDGQNIQSFIIQDIEFRGHFLIYTDGGLGATNIKVLRCTFDGTNTYCNGICFNQLGWSETTPEHFNNLYPISDIEVGYCTIRNAGDVAIHFSCATNNIWIHNNVIYYSTYAGIDCGGGDNIKIEYNLISGSGSHGIKIQPQLHTVDNLIIRYNLIMGIGTSTSGALLVYNSRGSQIYNNTFYAPKGGQSAAFFGWMPAKPVYFSGEGIWGFENNTIYNNIFYGEVNLLVPNNVPITYKDGTTINYSSPDVWVKNSFNNNIFYNPNSTNLIYKWEYGSNDAIVYNASVPGNYSYNPTPTVSVVSTASNFNSTWLNKSNISLDKNVNPNFVNPYWNSPTDYGDFSSPYNPGIGVDPKALTTNTETDPATLNLMTPNGGENLLAGSVYNITWTSSNVEYIKLEYTTNNGNNWNTIVNSIQASSDSYSWTIPATPSSNCKVRISDASNPALNDFSNNSFTIYQPTIILTSPNGGENWITGEVHSINWTSNYVSYVKIDYTTDNGTNWNSIVASTLASNGSYSWTIPNIQSSNCKVRISNVDNPAISDISNNSFTVITSYVNVNIKVFLQSPFNNGSMNTTLRNNGILPLSQPYNVSPWNYSGSEIVSTIPNETVDWVLLEIRKDTSASSTIARRAALLKNNGEVVDLDGTSNVKFNNLSSGNYYIIVKHRNHLAIITATPVQISQTTPLYDFTTSLDKAYGSNSMNLLSDGIYGICSGDANSDGVVNVLDYGQVGNSIFNQGYLREDLDMNGIINVLDYQKIYANIFKYSVVIK